MQIKNLKLHVGVAVLSLGASLSGCDRAAVSAPSASAAGLSYELVTQNRPDSLKTFVQVQKAYYDFCVASASILKLPVQPFVQIPPDFVLERNSYKSDGKSYYVKQQLFSIDADEMRPEKGCATRISEGIVIERVGKGSVEHVDIAIDGTRVAAPAGKPAPASHRGDNIGAYRVARTEHGVALRCKAPGDPGLNPGVITASCIVDAGAGGTLRDAQGTPLAAYARDELSAAMVGVLLTEPVSVRIGHVDAAVFAGELK